MAQSASGYFYAGETGAGSGSKTYNPGYKQAPVGAGSASQSYNPQNSQIKVGAGSASQYYNPFKANPNMAERSAISPVPESEEMRQAKMQNPQRLRSAQVQQDQNVAQQQSQTSQNLFNQGISSDSRAYGAAQQQVVDQASVNRQNALNDVLDVNLQNIMDVTSKESDRAYTEKQNFQDRMLSRREEIQDRQYSENLNTQQQNKSFWMSEYSKILNDTSRSAEDRALAAQKLEELTGNSGQYTGDGTDSLLVGGERTTGAQQAIDAESANLKTLFPQWDAATTQKAAQLIAAYGEEYRDQIYAQANAGTLGDYNPAAATGIVNGLQSGKQTDNSLAFSDWKSLKSDPQAFSNFVDYYNTEGGGSAFGNGPSTATKTPSKGNVVVWEGRPQKVFFSDGKTILTYDLLSGAYMQYAAGGADQGIRLTEDIIRGDYDWYFPKITYDMTAADKAYQKEAAQAGGV